MRQAFLQALRQAFFSPFPQPLFHPTRYDFHDALLLLGDQFLDSAWKPCLSSMAYGEPAADAQKPPAISEAELKACFCDLALGIRKGEPIADETLVAAINESEAEEIQKRRARYGIAEGFFSRAITSGKVQPNSVSDWFRHLAENLLEPAGN